MNIQNNRKDREGIVYSTDSQYEYVYRKEEEQSTLPPPQQKLRVQLDKSMRAGKQVSLVTGFVGTQTDLEALGKIIKTKCGVGGSVKDGEIIIQGDHRGKIVKILQNEGYTIKQIG